LELYRQEGLADLISKKGGRPGNHHLSDVFKEGVIGLLEAKYSDFGPLLSQKKLP